MTDAAVPLISLIVPAFNEEGNLPTLLESVAEARDRYRRGAQRVEVVVADNASTDETSRIAMEARCRVVVVSERSIARARNAGAAAARASVVAFVDADSRVHPETFNAIDTTLTDDVIAGATGIRMSRTSIGIALSMFVATTITRLANIDSGVLFCRRADWEAIGGFNEAKRFAEDIEFLLSLQRLGRLRGQRFARAKGVVTVTSARKFDQYGDWHYFSTLLRAVSWSIDRRGFRSFVQRYWYHRN